MTTESIKNKIPGIAVALLIAVFATALTRLKIGSFSTDVVGAPVFAILTGMVITLFAPGFVNNGRVKEGIAYTSKKILQYAVILLGFSLNLGVIARVGLKSLPVICSTIAISLITAFIMMKVLKVEGKTAALIGIGSSICGGSAIAASAPVLGADDEDIAGAVSVVFFFNVLAALVFPYFGYAIGLGSEGFAVFAGTAVNDTSSVTATAAVAENIYNNNGILSYAVTVKLTRTLAIIPITLGLAVWMGRKDKKTQGFSFKRSFPMFILWFLVASCLTSLVGLLPAEGFNAFWFDSFVPLMKFLSKLMIAMAMAAIGLKTNIGELIRKGGKPLLLGLCCWVAITAVSLLMQLSTGLFYSEL